MNLRQMVDEQAADAATEETQKITIEAAKVFMKNEEDKKYKRGEIRVLKGSTDRITILASHADGTLDVVKNKNGRKFQVTREDTTDFRKF